MPINISQMISIVHFHIIVLYIFEQLQLTFIWLFFPVSSCFIFLFLDYMSKRALPVRSTRGQLPPHLRETPNTPKAQRTKPPEDK